VFDNHGRRALYVDFVSSHAIAMQGEFYTHDGVHIFATSEGTTMDFSKRRRLEAGKGRGVPAANDNSAQVPVVLHIE
jgi:hypothetical protein